MQGCKLSASPFQTASEPCSKAGPDPSNPSPSNRHSEEASRMASRAQQQSPLAAAGGGASAPQEQTLRQRHSRCTELSRPPQPETRPEAQVSRPRTTTPAGSKPLVAALLSLEAGKPPLSSPGPSSQAAPPSRTQSTRTRSQAKPWDLATNQPTQLLFNVSPTPHPIQIHTPTPSQRKGRQPSPRARPDPSSSAGPNPYLGISQPEGVSGWYSGGAPLGSPFQKGVGAASGPGSEGMLRQEPPARDPRNAAAGRGPVQEGPVRGSLALSGPQKRVRARGPAQPPACFDCPVCLETCVRDEVWWVGVDSF